jgi:hypothetical protein
LRGHLAEYGLVVAQGPAHITKLIDQVEDPTSDLPEAARLALAMLVGTLRILRKRHDMRTVIDQFATSVDAPVNARKIFVRALRVVGC